ncbi:hypothetical protein GUA87_06490 [Sneathiella sp. P13V-1]|uniref:CbiX/SirB N-terminal domain-containing protein n=1 Tax=Sneathiella sp. P13V-1 TaxID=2697366 RepID=UPI00187B2EFD|nr:CbiX/SirB N-terminal domain-containing protein [Sneathiella sp. P13V-1]MBE7636488.1 hypothetical protein [Sneathiella sp. P13V-1]
MPSRPSLIIVGHGSSTSSAAEEAANEHAITLRQSRRFGSVLTHFIQKGKGLPPLPDGEVFILPFFMSDGFFVNRKIPELFDLVGGERRSARQHITLCDAIGMDPELADIIDGCAAEVRQRHRIFTKDLGLLLVAHGSTKNSASRDAAVKQQQAVQTRNIADCVEVAFLEEPPSIEECLVRLGKTYKHIVMIGLFSANGPHATEDVAEAICRFERKIGSNDTARPALYYQGAIGVRPEIVRLIQNSISRKAAAVG